MENQKIVLRVQKSLRDEETLNYLGSMSFYHFSQEDSFLNEREGIQPSD